MVHEGGNMTDGKVRYVIGNRHKKLPSRPKVPPRMVSLYRLIRLMHCDARRVAAEPHVMGRVARGGGYDGTGRKIKAEAHGLEEQPPHVSERLFGIRKNG